METLGHSQLPTSQVIYVVQEGKKRQSVNESYNARAAIILGSIHIVCGVIAMVADIVGIVYGNAPFSTGIWTSVFFIVSGSLAIAGARSGNKCLVIATMVMAIITAVFAGFLLFMSSFWVVIGNIGNCHFPSGRRFSSINCGNRVLGYPECDRPGDADLPHLLLRPLLPRHLLPACRPGRGQLPEVLIQNAST